MPQDDTLLAASAQEQAAASLTEKQNTTIPPRWAWWRHLLVWVVLLVVCVTAFRLGASYRQWTFEYTTPIRYFGDIHRGCRWGVIAAKDGYLNLYEKKGDQEVDDGQWLDYSPLRLLVMRCWGEWIINHYPEARKYDTNDFYNTPWQPAYEFNAPVLNFNMYLEALTALGAFLLVRHWVIKTNAPPPAFAPAAWFRKHILQQPEVAYLPNQRRPYQGVLRGLMAAMLIWFNPAIVLSSQAWPTWDMWVIPFYIYAIFFAVTEWWFVAGLAIGVGAMFKGQQLFVAPIFIIWPLVLGRPGAAVRWAVGLLTGMAAVASPWLLSYLPNGDLQAERVLDMPMLWWVGSCGVAALVGPWVVRGFRIAAPFAPTATPFQVKKLLVQAGWWVGGALLMSGLMLWPWLHGEWWWITGVVVATSGLGTLLVLPWWLLGQARSLPKGAWRGWAVWCAGAAVAFSLLVGGGLVSCVGGEVYGLLKHVIIDLPVNGPKPSPGLWGQPWLVSSVFAAMLVATVGVMRLRRIGVLVAAAVMIPTVLTLLYGHGSTGWIRCSFLYGTKHWETMVMGQTSNLPGILSQVYGYGSVLYKVKFGPWTMPAGVMVLTVLGATVGLGSYWFYRGRMWRRWQFVAAQVALAGAGLTTAGLILAHHQWQWWGLLVWMPAQKVAMKPLLFTIYAVLLVVSAIGIAAMARRHDRRFLVAIVTPWLLFFCIPAQIHERYLLYAAGVSVCVVGYRWGLAWLSVFFTVVTWMMTIHVMLSGRGRWMFARDISIDAGQRLFNFIQGTFPHIGWAVMLGTAVFLYFTLVPGKREWEIEKLRD